MKRVPCTATLILGLLLSFTLAQRETNKQPALLLPVRVGGKWGYINQTGKIAIKPRFLVASDFSEGRAWVRDENTWFYLIDETGRPVSPGKYYRYADRFSDGLAAVQFESLEGKIGFIDRNGRTVIDYKFDGYTGKIIGSFNDGLAFVLINGKIGFIDHSGRFVIEPTFEADTVLNATPFSEDLAVIRLNGKYGYTNKTGEIKIFPKFETASNFYEGVAAVSSDRQKFGFIDKSGEFVIAPSFDWAGPFSEGLAPVNIGMAWHGHQKSGGKWGFIDRTGDMVIDPKYDAVNGFSEGLAGVMLNGKWGFIDKSGQIRIGLQFDWAEPFENGFSKVTLGEKIGYIDKTGIYLWNPSK